jgi:hypothetical protein
LCFVQFSYPFINTFAGEKWFCIASDRLDVLVLPFTFFYCQNLEQKNITCTVLEQYEVKKVEVNVYISSVEDVNDSVERCK